MTFRQLHGPSRDQFPESLGSKLGAASLSVVFASDASLPITLSNDTNYGTPGASTLRSAAMLGVGSTAVSNANPVPVSDAGSALSIDGHVVTASGSVSAVNTNAIESTDVSTYSEAIIQTSGTFTAGFVVQFSNDNTNWVSAYMTRLSTISAPVNSGSAADLFAVPIKGRYFRVRCTSYTSGTIQVDVVFTTAPKYNNNGVNVSAASTLGVSATQSGTWNITNVSGTVSLPTGASTEATLSAMSAKLPASLGAKTTAASLSVCFASDIAALAVSQSGTWNINDISGTISLPTGASTEATLSTLNGKVANGTGTAAGAVRIVPASDSPSPQGRAYADSARNSHSSVNVTTGAWVELIASTAADINALMIFDSSGQTLELGTGAATSEARKLIIPPGGIDGPVPLRIASGTRVAVRAVSANATTGELCITGLT